MGKKLKSVLPIAAAVIGNAIAPGVGASIGSGLGTLASGGGIKNALLAGVGSSIGSSIGGSLTSKTIGSSLGIGGAAASTAGSLPWQTATNVIGQSTLPWAVASNSLGSIGSTIANTNLGSALGSFYGSNLATNALSEEEQKPKATAAADSQTAPLTPFQPKQEPQKDVPLSLSSLGSLTNAQQGSNLANQGVYGGGNGPDEQSYFMNLVNRRLVDESGNVDSDTSELLPIELSYLKRLGLGGYGNSRDLLEAMSKWKAA